MNEHYEAVLADLEQMKTDAEDGIRAIRRLMARPVGRVASSLDGTAKTTIPPSDRGTDDSIPILVQLFLEEQPNRSFRFEEIAKGINASNPKTLRGALSRMAKTGKIGKHGRGRYRAARTKGQNEVAPATAA